MDVEQQPEWLELCREARVALERGEWSLRLGVFPTFGPPEVFGIGSAGRQVVCARKLRSEQFTQVRWRTWCQAIDYEKLRTPVDRLRHPRKLEPTIRFREADLERAELDQLFQGLGEVRIPACPVGLVAGTDGISFELFAESGFHWCNFKWWRDHPSEWRPLMDWFEQTRQALAEMLGEVPDQYSNDSTTTNDSSSSRIDA